MLSRLRKIFDDDDGGGGGKRPEIISHSFVIGALSLEHSEAAATATAAAIAAATASTFAIDQLPRIIISIMFIVT